MFDDVTISEFWNNVDKRGPDECWAWLGYRSEKGYGQYSGRRATHVSLIIAGSTRPSNLMALHSCDNPWCVNPAHLRWGTAAENVHDMVSRKRHRSNKRDFCVNGHPFSGSNLAIRSDGTHRRCRKCAVIYNREQRARRKEGKNYAG